MSSAATIPQARGPDHTAAFLCDLFPLQAKTKASEQRASDEGTATQGLRVKLEGMEADRAQPRRWRGVSRNRSDSIVRASPTRTLI